MFLFITVTISFRVTMGSVLFQRLESWNRSGKSPMQKSNNNISGSCRVDGLYRSGMRSLSSRMKALDDVSMVNEFLFLFAWIFSKGSIKA